MLNEELIDEVYSKYKQEAEEHNNFCGRKISLSPDFFSREDVSSIVEWYAERVERWYLKYQWFAFELEALFRAQCAAQCGDKRIKISNDGTKAVEEGCRLLRIVWETVITYFFEIKSIAKYRIKEMSERIGTHKPHLREYFCAENLDTLYTLTKRDGYSVYSTRRPMFKSRSHFMENVLTSERNTHEQTT